MGQMNECLRMQLYKTNLRGYVEWTGLETSWNGPKPGWSITSLFASSLNVFDVSPMQ